MNIENALLLKKKWLAEPMPGMATSMRAGKQIAAAMRAGPVRAMPLDAIREMFRRGPAVGFTRGKTKNDYKMVVHVEKRFVAESEPVERMRKEARGELVVRVTGRAHAMAGLRQQQRIRPLEPGLSVGHIKVTAGTLGAFVSLKGDGKNVHMLSNNHVLANENAAKLGDAIVQPGVLDGGDPEDDVVALLSAFKRISFKNPNRYDCALARLKKGIKHTGNRFPKIRELEGVKEAEPGMKVFKVGRTTGLKHGKITDVEVDRRWIEYDRGDARFDGIITVESTKKGQPFCDGGDSGSLIVSEDGYAVGLLFAGTPSGGAFNLGLTYANPIQEVLSALNAALIIECDTI